MRIIHKMLMVAAAVASSLVLSACTGSAGSAGGTGGTGGGGGGGGGGVGAGVIAGTAATGAPIVGQVVAMDVSGQKFFGTSSAAGAYTVNVAGGTAPFILTVTGMSGGNAVTLNSVATASGQTVNITPLTDLIVSTAAGQPGGATLSNLCAAADLTLCKAALTAATTGTNLSAAVTAVKSMIAPLNTGGVDPLNGNFDANGSGMDAVLDQILVTPAAGQGAMATVTLISVPGQQLGTVTMPATVGGTSTPATVPTNSGDITAATEAQNALSEIRVCLASFNALYPANMTTPPASADVMPFFDATFSLGVGRTAGSILDQAFVVNLTSTLPAADGVAQPGFSVTATGLSKFAFNPQIDPAYVYSNFSPVSPSVSPTTAWVKVSVPLAGADLANWKMLKGAAYTGCPGGWKMAGTGHIDLHMQARVNKWNFSGAVTYTRELPFHVQTRKAVFDGINSIVVKGPGLSTYITGAPATLTNTLVLVVPPVPTPPAVQLSAMVIQGQLGGYYNNSDAIKSCQDLAAIVAPATLPPTGTPCYDENAVAPGATFKYILKDSVGAVLSVFPYQIAAVPLSKAFVIANAADLFARNVTATPAGVAALNIAASALSVTTPLENMITFNYTQSSVYGARTDHCGIGVTDVSNVVILQAEQSAVGLQTSCTFKTTAGLNSGSLAQPVDSITGLRIPFGGTNSYMYVNNNVLGNAAGSLQPYQ